MTTRPDDENGRPAGETSDALAPFGFDAPGDAWLETLRQAQRPGELGTVGRYELLEEVGRGGQGVVHRARDRRTGQLVAVKQVRYDNGARPAQTRRFEREMETAALLEHPSIVRVVGVDTLDDRAILAMEWIDGEPISTWASHHASGRRPEREIVRMTIALCDAVHHAHQRGVIHRDLKPSNILVDAAGAPHLLDFGVAKLDRPMGGTHALTHSGQYLGTPLYSSPEQIRDGVEGLDIRTDVYSLGVVLYESLTERWPYGETRTLARVFEAIQTVQPIRPSALRPVGRDLEAIVLKAIEKDPNDRYASVDALRRDLACYAAGLPVDARRGGNLYHLRKLARRNWPVIAVAGALMMLITAFAVTATVQQRRVEREALRTREIMGFLGTMLTPAGLQSGEAGLVLDITRRAEDRLRTELNGRPDVEAGVRSALAGVHAGFWRWDDANAHAQYVIDHYARTGKRASAELADALEVASVARGLRSDPRAIGLAQRALAIREAEHGRDHWTVAAAQAALGLALWRTQGPRGFEEAETQFERADEIFARTPAAIARWAGLNHNWAAKYRAEGKPDRADARYRTALALYARSQSGFVAPHIHCLDEFAGFLEQKDRAADAESVIVGALAGLAEDVPDPRMQRLQERLARIQAARGDLASAARSAARALATRCDVLSHELPGRGLGLRILAADLRAQPPERIDCDAMRAVFAPLDAEHRREADRLRAAIGDLLRRAGQETAAAAWTDG